MKTIATFEELASAVEYTRDVLEPFDPEYLTNEPYQVPEISPYEKKFYRKMNIVINKLRREHINFEWLENAEMFRVKKYRYTLVSNMRKKDGSLYKPKKVYNECPTYMYIGIYMDTNEYCFGGWEEDLIVSSRISEVITEVKEWLNNNEPAVR